MARILLILALVATAFWVYTIVDVSVQSPARHRGVSKPIWILIVVLLPVLGGLLWLTVGRVRRSSLAARSAPDDDPDFLGKLGTMSDQDERIRRLEEELAMLDAEDDDPRWKITGATGTAAGSATTGSAAPETPTRGPERPDGDDDTRGQRGAAG